VGSTKRAWDDAVRMGVRNREWVELARRHCLNMEVVPSGGRGMAEEATGLPIDMRQVRCHVAHGDMSANLPWVMTDFFRKHCVGCVARRPTGEVPNLATTVEDADAAAAAGRAAEEADLARRRDEWQPRADSRRSLASSSGEAMAGVLRDVDVLDGDPASPAAAADRDAARPRRGSRGPRLWAVLGGGRRGVPGRCRLGGRIRAPGRAPAAGAGTAGVRGGRRPRGGRRAAFRAGDVGGALCRGALRARRRGRPERRRLPVAGLAGGRAGARQARPVAAGPGERPDGAARRRRRRP